MLDLCWTVALRYYNSTSATGPYLRARVHTLWSVINSSAGCPAHGLFGSELYQDAIATQRHTHNPRQGALPKSTWYCRSFSVRPHSATLPALTSFLTPVVSTPAAE
jgi:hypothetical protein